MTVNRQKRSSNPEITQPPGQPSGVGGRHGSGSLVAGRGGYPDVCNDSGSSVRDPRLAELRECGLGRHWMRVAQEIGVDNFLACWRVLSQDDSVQDDCGRVHIPSIGTYLRLQRNKLIATLAARGSTAGEIQQELKQQLGYDLDLSWIRKLMREWKE